MNRHRWVPAFVAGFIGTVHRVSAAPVINKFLADNVANRADMDGEFSD